MVIKYDRELLLNQMKCKVRFIPSFEKRYSEWDKKAIETTYCPFCNRWDNSKKTVFDEFHIIENDYPFMSNQFTIFGKDHIEYFDANKIISAINLVNINPDCQSGGLQISGSGASIPKHAHFSISDEKLPIFNLKSELLIKERYFKISRFIGCPHLALIITGETNTIALVAERILKKIISMGLSYNLLFKKGNEIIIIPRTSEESTSLKRKVGVSLVGGIYPCYMETVQPEIQKVDIKKEMLAHWKSVASDDLVNALQETTIAPEFYKKFLTATIDVN